jgi:hypothetical protein
MRCSKGLNVLVAAVVYSSLLSVTAAAEDPHRAASKTAASGVEEIYVVRSWRESRAPATDFCAQSHTNFGNVTSEDHYSPLAPGYLNASTAKSERPKRR